MCETNFCSRNVRDLFTKNLAKKKTFYYGRPSQHTLLIERSEKLDENIIEKVQSVLVNWKVDTRKSCWISIVIDEKMIVVQAKDEED